MAKRRNPITGQWSARKIDMQRSFAWRVLSRGAHQCLSRIEIELADHGGNDIDELPVTFNDFEEYGVNRHAIGPALAELETLGFIDITEHGIAARAAEYRRSNKFRLLTRPWEKHGPACRPRWDRFKSFDEAEGAAAQARRSAIKEKSASAETAPKPVRKPHHEAKKADAESAPLANVGKRTTIYISGGKRRIDDHAPTAPATPPDPLTPTGALLANVAKLPWPPRFIEINPAIDEALSRVIDGRCSQCRPAPIDALTELEELILSKTLPDRSAVREAVH
jgi:hypothetical protein